MPTGFRMTKGQSGIFLTKNRRGSPSVWLGIAIQRKAEKDLIIYGVLAGEALHGLDEIGSAVGTGEWRRDAAIIDT